MFPLVYIVIQFPRFLDDNARYFFCLEKVLLRLLFGIIFQKIVVNFLKVDCIWKSLSCHVGTRSSFLCTPLMGMAKVQGTSGRAPEAINTYQRVIEILESIGGGETREMILPLCALGNLLIKEGRASDAEFTFSRLVKCITDKFLLHQKPLFVPMVTIC